MEYEIKMQMRFDRKYLCDTNLNLDVCIQLLYQLVFTLKSNHRRMQEEAKIAPPRCSVYSFSASSRKLRPLYVWVRIPLLALAYICTRTSEGTIRLRFIPSHVDVPVLVPVLP